MTSDATQSPAPLRFATFLAPNMYSVYERIVAFIERRLYIPVSLVVGASFEDFARGEIDAGFICGLPYVQLTRCAEPPVELLAAPALQGQRYQRRPIYFSDVIVRRASVYQTFLDLRGCAWAYNDHDSQSGYNITRFTLVRLGEIHGFFGRVVEAGYHQEAIQMVVRGEVDAAAIDTQVLTIELRDQVDPQEQIRVIATLGPSTIQPVVAARRLPDSLKDGLRTALYALGDDPTMRATLDDGIIERFVAITDATYDDIRAMVDAAEALDFLSLR
jgi:phosphate/phosphite/phosphonate ABC transporter binding protein